MNFDILKNSTIPFALGQSSLYGADCFGLVVVYYKMQGITMPEKNIHRRPCTYESFVKMAIERVGVVGDPNGDIVIFNDQGNIGHCGITNGIDLVYQCNVGNGTRVVKLRSHHPRYRYTPQTKVVK